MKSVWTTPQSERNAELLVERRSKPRLQCSYHAMVRGSDVLDGRFEERAVLSNMSACGFYLRMKRCARMGEKLFVFVRLSTAELSQSSAPKIGAIGQVVRVEPLPDGTLGIALQLSRHRVL